MNAINRLLAAAGLALAMVVALPAAAAPMAERPASCKIEPCGVPLCMDVGECPSPWLP